MLRRARIVIPDRKKGEYGVGHPLRGRVGVNRMACFLFL